MDTEDDEFVEENELEGRKDELEAEPIKEGNPREETLVECKPKEDPGENPNEEPLREDDLEEDLMEEEDP